MRILVDMGHPAHVHLFRFIFDGWEKAGIKYRVLARKKDITLRLLDIYGIPYIVPPAVKLSASGLVKELIQREMALLRVGISFKPNIITGTSINASRVARIVGARSVILNEDDALVAPFFRWFAYPFASAIVTPDTLAFENYGRRHLTYPGNHELFYLHPNRFTPDKKILREIGIAKNEDYAIIRLSALQAHHDTGKRGISEDLLRKVIKLVNGRMRLFITSEKEILPEFEQYRMHIPPEKIHHALYFAEFFMGDSQTMTAESAVLGTPSFRINDFVGRCSIITDLEEYGLSFGFKPGQEKSLIDELEKVLGMDDRAEVFRTRRKKMLSDKIDPLPWILEVYKKMLKGIKIGQIKDSMVVKT